MIDTKKLRERVSMNIDGRLWDLADEIDRALEELDELRAKVAGTDIHMSKSMEKRFAIQHEALVEELAAAKAAVEKYKKETATAWTRIAELEAALREIAAGNPASPGKWLSDVQMADMARAALSVTASPAAAKTDDHSETCKTLNWCGNHLTPVQWANVDRMIQAARDAVEHGVVPDPWESRIWKALNAIDGDDSLDTHNGEKK